jgi:hypothetical protein
MSIAAYMVICYIAKSPRLAIGRKPASRPSQGVKKAVVSRPKGHEDHGLLFKSVWRPRMFSWILQSGML